MPYKTKRRPSMSRKLKIIMATCLALVLALVLSGLFMRQQEILAQKAAEAANYTPPPAPTIAPQEEQPVVAFIGDSYTAGAGGTNGGFVGLLERSNAWEVHNLGVGGTGYAASQSETGGTEACGQEQCLGYIDVIPQAVEVGADIVIVSGGRNEATAPTDVQAQNVEAFFQSLRSALPDAQIVAFNPVWDSEPAPSSLADMSAAVQSSVEAVGGSFVDIGQPLEGHPEYITEDGIHPNDEGYTALFVPMEEALDRVLS